MNIGDYLNRIQYHGPTEPTLETLTGLHQAYLLNVTYENLDIHLGRTLPLDERATFEKIVTRRRGGWCYEMNGLFAWGLRQLGFSVTLLASAVNRAAQGDKAERNHLISLVQLDRPYLVDVGFGNGFLRPLPLEPGPYQQDFLDYRLDFDGQRWQFTNHAYGGAGYDFTLDPRQIADFAERCHYLQTSPESGFVRVVVCHRFLPGRLISLRGLVLRTVTEGGAYDETIEDEAAYRQVLNERFDLFLPDAEQSKLWEICYRKHQEFLQQQNS